MLTNKYLNLVYLPVISIVFGIAMSTSLVEADSSLKSSSGFTLLRINEELNIHQEHAQAGENIGEEDLQAEELNGLEEYEIAITGMTCANCESKVKEALLKCSGVKTVWVSHVEGSAVIEANANMVDGDEIIAAIEKAGFSYVEEE